MDSANGYANNWTTQLGDRIRRDIPSRQAWPQLLGQPPNVTPATYHAHDAKGVTAGSVIGVPIDTPAVSA